MLLVTVFSHGIVVLHQTCRLLEWGFFIKEKKDRKAKHFNILFPGEKGLMWLVSEVFYFTCTAELSIS